MEEKVERNILIRGEKMKTIIITGGSRGIGRCLVENIAKERL